MKKKTIYICGKISGLPINEVTKKFTASQKQLEGLGYYVINPINVVDDWSMDWQSAMRLCIAALMECDYIYLLVDYVDSRGAWMEQEIARKVGIKLIKDKEINRHV